MQESASPELGEKINLLRMQLHGQEQTGPRHWTLSNYKTNWKVFRHKILDEKKTVIIHHLSYYK